MQAWSREQRGGPTMFTSQKAGSPELTPLQIQHRAYNDMTFLKTGVTTDNLWTIAYVLLGLILDGHDHAVVCRNRHENDAHGLPTANRAFSSC